MSKWLRHYAGIFPAGNKYKKALEMINETCVFDYRTFKLESA